MSFVVNGQQCHFHLIFIASTPFSAVCLVYFYIFFTYIVVTAAVVVAIYVLVLAEALIAGADTTTPVTGTCGTTLTARR